MRVAITGATGFVGRHLAMRLSAEGHTVVGLARSADRYPELTDLPGVSLEAVDLTNPRGLAQSLAGCDAVAHLAGINREIGSQTYDAVHVEATRAVIEAATEAGVQRVALLSFLRARPDCGSPYHESKWAAEELARHSGLDFTILKAGVIYGRGDHMLDHLSHAFYTLPLFGLVGMRPRLVAPVAVADVARVLAAGLVKGRLSDATVAVIGPEIMTLETAVRRVADATGKHPLFFRLPVGAHYGLAWLAERTMKVPLVAMAQVRILSEGIVDPLPFAEPLPADLAPATTFDRASIVAGLPPRGRFTTADLACVPPPILARVLGSS
jgi:NADH dehydrogenase